MDITGKIILELPERSGVSARTGSEWRLKQFVLETMEQYPKKMVFEVFGNDRINSMNIQVGGVYTISYDIDAHEFNGRWFNGIRAFQAVPAAAAQPGAAAAPAAAPAAPPFAAAPAAPGAAPAAPANGTADDLPF